MAAIAQIKASRGQNSIGQAIPNFPDNGFVVVPHNTDYYDMPITVMASEAGDVEVVPAGSGIEGDPIVVTLPAGGFVPFRVCRVLATNTTVTAGNLIGAY